MRTLTRTLVHYDERSWLVRAFGRDWKLGVAATRAVELRPDLERVTIRGNAHSGMLWVFVLEGEWVHLGNAFLLDDGKPLAVPADVWPDA